MQNDIKICTYHGKFRPQADGKCLTCSKIKEFDMQYKIDEIIQEANIPLKFEYSTFENYIDDKNLLPPAIKNYDLTKNLFLVGTTGTGKTHIAVSLIKKMASNLVESRYVRYDELIDLKINNSQEYKQLIMYKFLVIDEFGIHDNNFKNEIISEIIAKRYDNLLFTCIVSNLSGDVLKSKMTEATFSRITEHGKFLLHKFVNKDYRREK